MKHTFVLDEGVWISAAQWSGESGSEGEAALRLLVQIAHNCHRLAFSTELSRKARSQLSSHRGHNTNRVFRLLKEVEVILDKTVQETDPPPFENEQAVPRKDRYLARLAGRTGAVLVTTDNRLIARIRSAGLLNLSALRPEDALPLARET